MIRFLSILLSLLVAFHGLIHLMGFLAYWPLREFPALPYKTALLSGRWEIGATGMRLFSLLWLIAALGFILSATALLFGKPWWAPVMLAASLLSLLICILDWGVAFRGAIVDLLLLLMLFVVFGFRQPPVPLPPYTAAAAPITTVPLPSGLPAPVGRYLRLTYGDELPVYTSAVMSGRGTVRFMGVIMPARLRFSHASGQSYRHYIETTFYGIPLLKVSERYLDGHTRFELPFGVEEDKPGVDSAANQGLWAETIFYPAYLVTDPRLRWQAVDDNTAKLFVPFKDGEQEFTLQFDPQSGLMTHIETLRFRDEKSGTLRWWGDQLYEPDQNGDPQLKGFAVTWGDEGTPWLVIRIEDIVFNTDVSQYLRQQGP
jgi:hypothetical protein